MRLHTADGNALRANDQVWYGMAWHGMAWHGMAWHGLAWHGMAWHGMAWHDMVHLFFRQYNNYNIK